MKPFFISSSLVLSFPKSRREKETLTCDSAQHGAWQWRAVGED